MATTSIMPLHTGQVRGKDDIIAYYLRQSLLKKSILT